MLLAINTFPYKRQYCCARILVSLRLTLRHPLRRYELALGKRYADFANIWLTH